MVPLADRWRDKKVIERTSTKEQWTQEAILKLTFDEWDQSALLAFEEVLVKLPCTFLSFVSTGRLFERKRYKGKLFTL